MPNRTATCQRILVTGSTGMLGQALCREAAGLDYQVIPVARGAGADACDLTDGSSIAALLERHRPEIVVNTAAITNLTACERDPGAAYLVNARAVALMAEACARLGSYLVQISTDHYFADDRDRKHPETAPVRLLNEYARSKYAGEAFALTSRGALVVRTNIVGLRRRGEPTFAEWAIKALVNGEPMTLFDDFYTSSIDVTAFSKALLRLLPLRPQGVLNLAAGEVASKKEFITLLAEALGLSVDHAATGSVAGIAGVRRAESLGLDVSKAEELLGYRLPDTREVVEALAVQYRG